MVPRFRKDAEKMPPCSAWLHIADTIEQAPTLFRPRAYHISVVLHSSKHRFCAPQSILSHSDVLCSIDSQLDAVILRLLSVVVGCSVFRCDSL